MGSSTSTVYNRGGNGRSVSDSEYFPSSNENNFSNVRSKSSDSTASHASHAYSSSKINNGSMKEHKRFGVVSVKISNAIMAINMNERNRVQEGVVNYTITPRGSILYGTLCTPNNIHTGDYFITFICKLKFYLYIHSYPALEQSELPVMIPGEIPLTDSRAHKLLVTYCYGTQQDSHTTSASDTNRHIQFKIEIYYYILVDGLQFLILSRSPAIQVILYSIIICKIDLNISI